MEKESIWLKKEADDWNEAFPIGNGSFGAMVFGKTGVERIQVNEDSVWSGAAMNRTNPDAKANYKKVRSLLLEGRIQEAEQLAEWSMYATNPHMRHYQTLGDIWIRFYKHQGKKIVKKTQGELLSVEYEDLPFTDYQRELDLEQAVGNVRYKVGEASYEREYFVSYPDQVMVYRMQAENGASLDLDVFLTRKDNRPGRGASYCDGVEVLEDGTIRLYGMQGGRDGIAFELAVQVEAQGGTKRRMGSHIIVANAKEALLYVTARTSFRTMEPLAWCLEALKKARRYTYQELKQRHIQDYQSCYLQSILKLEHDPALSALSTPERLERMRSGAQDVGLVNTYFNFAKYLLISSSREGSLPANLQGIWNDQMEPAWGSKYTININIQMNYWLAEKAGLSSLHMPLLEHLKRMYPRGKSVADKMYGIEGFCCHHNTDLWGDCAPQDNHVSATLWPMGGAWLCLHLIQHYRYTKDAQFLEEYYEILKDAVRFFLAYMVKDNKGCWISGPSSSPENIYQNEKGESGCLCMGASMDSELIRELFEGYLELTAEKEASDELNAQVMERLAGMAPLQIGKYGQIQEWNEDYDEIEPGHRHISQLFALYPASQIRMDETPQLAQAAKRTIERRLSFGGGHTGWSKAWIILFYARLWEGDAAWKHLNDLLRYATLDNLFDNHPPFQIDGNFGGACGLLEMLVQDYRDRVYLLPALTDALKDGEVRGIHLEMGAVLKMSWKNGMEEYIGITGKRACSFRLYTRTGHELEVRLESGQTVSYDKSSFQVKN